ncbi:hypothetical protein [Macrococcus sp. DPC7161]|uniref:hypothetical protein n=1 Tax=Macrococcus sp. DPC7161 TaxID=2507060 RepID=UPI00100BF25B|nr:hypothetical protein [Macrococcus sp. DPC7161]RXK19245.1 hypothetical protein ER639_02700 [Macrococcus sp. DPC7161]
MDLLNEYTRIYEIKGIMSQQNIKHQKQLLSHALLHWVNDMLPLKRWQIAPTNFLNLYDQILQHPNFFEPKQTILQETNIKLNTTIVYAFIHFKEEIEFLDINTKDFIPIFEQINVICSSDLPQNKLKVTTIEYNALEQLQYEIQIGEKNKLFLIIKAFIQFIKDNIRHPAVSIYSSMMLYASLLKHDFNVLLFESIIYQLPSKIKMLRNEQIDEYVFEQYIIQNLLEAYEKFYNFIQQEKELTPNEKVLNTLAVHYEPLSRIDLQMQIPSISQKTIERSLVSLQKMQLIEKVGKGKATKYKLI